MAGFVPGSVRGGGSEPRCDGSCSSGVPGDLSGLGAQCGLPSAELLSAVDLVLAGRGEGGVPRSCEHRFRIRNARAQSLVRDAAALGRVAEELYQADALSRFHALQRLPARPLHLPILRRARGTDVRPRDPALEGWGHELAERRRGVFGLQSAKGRPVAAGRPYVARAQALPADGARPAPERPAVPTQLPPRELDGLSVLGQRAGAVGSRARRGDLETLVHGSEVPPPPDPRG